MLSWEKGGIAPIYLCDSHAVQIVKTSQGVMAMTPQAVPSNHPTEQPKRSVASGGPADAQVGTAKKDLAEVKAPVREAASVESAKALANEVTGNVAREDFDVYRTALQGVKPSTATEEKQTDRADLERTCVSRYGQRCTCDASVHCPKCGRWFCDAHGEDEKWHTCALPI
jgi:hypothetical protein